MSIEIVGRACRVPGADTPEELFTLLCERRCTISEIPDDRWDKSRYWHPQMGVPGKTYTFAAGIVPDTLNIDHAVFGISPREAESLDPQQRVILQMVWRAMEDASLTADDLKNERVGVYVGASNVEYGNLAVGDPAGASPYFMTGSTLSIVSNRISHVLGVRGPSMTIDTACSSGMVALDLAVRALEVGDIDTAIVGSINILGHPLSFVGFAQARMLSPEGLCRAYGNNGEGYVRSEGGVAIILRKTEHAAAMGDRSHARIVATGVNSDGHTNGISLPSGEAQASLLRSIYQSKNIDLSRMAFIEGHGTGTKVGDPAEVWAIGKEIGQRRNAPIPIGSVKSNVGHTEPASGLVGLMKAMLALENDFLPPTLHAEHTNEEIDFKGLNVSVASMGLDLLSSKQIRYAGVNSFGFGGTNAHVVICDPDRAVPKRQDADNQILFVSAQSEDSLRQLLGSYQEIFAATDASKLPDLFSAIGANRHHMRHRFVMDGRDPAAVSEEIERYLSDETPEIAAVGRTFQNQAKTAFVFSGNGSQWVGMGVNALKNSASFRRHFEVIDALYSTVADFSLTELLTDPELETKLADTRIAQPLLFATQISLAHSLTEIGLRPDITYGHSIGEIAAAHFAGAISLVDAVKIVFLRSKYQHALAGKGGMAAVALGAEDAVAMAVAAGLENIVCAAFNSPKSSTISGPADEISAFRDVARKQGVAARVLDIDYPFHHPMIGSAHDEFVRDFGSIDLRKTEIPCISSVTGEILEGSDFGPDYWWRNIQRPVQFIAATKTAIRQGTEVFVEIGPRPILASYLRELVASEEVNGAVISTFEVKESSEHDPVFRSFCKAAASGASFDTTRAIGARNAFAQLPPLPFQAKAPVYPRTIEALDLYGDRRRDVHTLIGWRVDLSSHVWHNNIDAHLYPDLAEHVVDGNAILPASAFIDMVIAAARRFHGDQAFEITNLEILQPLALSSTKVLEVATVLSAETGHVEIKSRERLNEADWSLNVVARTRRSTSTASTAINTPLAEPTETIDADDVYRIAKRFKLDYGPQFQLLKQVRRFGDRHLEIELAAPAGEGHPYVSHELHPISTDAALHGLVGLFGHLAPDNGTAPYIPVHFGAIQVYQPGCVVRRAVISIERASKYSIKANLDLLDADGVIVARLRDCRLRRAHLKARRTLSAQTYHHQAIASDLPVPVDNFAALRPDVPVDLATLDLEAIADPAETDATQILKAALFRAAYDVTRRWAPASGRVTMADLGADKSVDCFIVSCLQALVPVDLASWDEAGESWQLAADCPLPEFADLLKEFFKEDGARSVEAILLNDAYYTALNLRPGATEPEGCDGVMEQMSASTLEHIHSHGRTVGSRTQYLLSALRQTLEASRKEHRPVRQIVELASVSKIFSQHLAALAETFGAKFTVIETNERRRSDLELAFDTFPHVEVMAEPPAGLHADIVVSASTGSYKQLAADGPGRTFLVNVLEHSGAFLACVDTGSFFDDFVFGLRDGWFSGTLDSRFPISDQPGSEDWRSLAEQLAVGKSDQALIATPIGEIMMLAWGGEVSVPAGLDQPVASIVIASRQTIDAAAGAARKPDAPRWLVQTDSDLVFESGPDQWQPGTVLTVMCESFGEEEGSRALLANIEILSSLLVKAADHPAASDSDPDAAPLQLAVLLPGGAPLLATASDSFAAARNAGLWQFLRVARNEYPAIEIHSFDLSGSDLSIADQVRLASQVCETKSANQEWYWDQGKGGLCEIRAVPGPATPGVNLTRSYEAAIVRSDAVSSIATLGWEVATQRPVEAGEVRVEVAATALNYRDLMWTMGLLSEEAFEDGFAGPSIGMEFSGRITEIGEGVKNYSVGDSVIGVAPQAFATHVVTDARGVAKLPNAVPVVAGATLPVAFLTTYYALVELGGLQAGETVLVHGGAGAVGLAALQIAKGVGAGVIATAGTDEKRDLLRTLGADFVFDSRSLDFVDGVHEITDGRGVDVVLNSLFGEAMERSISLLKPFGRFLELGKRDYYSDTKIGLRPFRQNISYFGIDADQLLQSRPGITAHVFERIAALFDSGENYVLPYREFAYDEIRDAFRLMQASGHIGKILVVPPRPGQDPVARKPASIRLDETDGAYLVFGGTRGFGLAASEWLVERGCRRLALASLRGALSESGTEKVARWRRLGVRVSIHACDVTSEDDLKALLTQLRADGPLSGIVHAAMQLDDALLVNLTPERNKAVIDTKARGAELLHRLTLKDPIREFIMFSSMTTLIGNPGQANYVAANGYLEGLARERRQMKLPALTVGFSAISDVGYLTTDEDAKAALTKRLEKFSMTSGDVLDRLGEVLSIDPGTVDAAAIYIADIHWNAAQNLKIVGSPLFNVPSRILKLNPSELSDGQLDLAAAIEGKSADEAETYIYELVAGEIARTLHIPASEIRRTRVIRDIGIDSLMAMELGMSFQQKTGFNLPLNNITDATTVGDVSHKLYLRILGTSEQGADVDNKDIVEELATRHTKAREAKASAS
ncbi:SDR family oxidoreductase [Hoeflea sp. J2-29]|uniref:SDR family oxidoreductase n=1 Tax=Hoeflea ulvae TaxID=2983764 RepID=A0ABT3YKG2_9HYPH|nr:SDR family oxidoreductase [Hoeflea ulvae]